MNGNDWVLLVVFGAAIWGISLISPEGAMLLGGFVAIVILTESGVFQRLTAMIGGES